MSCERREERVALQEEEVGGGLVKTTIKKKDVARRKRKRKRTRNRVRERERWNKVASSDPSPVYGRKEGEINSGPQKGPGHLQSPLPSRLLRVLPLQMPGLRPRSISP